MLGPQSNGATAERADSRRARLPNGAAPERRDCQAAHELTAKKSAQANGEESAKANGQESAQANGQESAQSKRRRGSPTARRRFKLRTSSPSVFATVGSRAVRQSRRLAVAPFGSPRSQPLRRQLMV